MENYEAKERVTGFLNGLSLTKRYLFLERALIVPRQPSYKEIAVNKTFIEYCRDDQLYSKHIMHGDVEIERPKKSTDKHGLHKEVEFIEPKFLENQFQILRNHFDGLQSKQMDIDRMDLLAALNEVMYEFKKELDK